MLFRSFVRNARSKRNIYISSPIHHVDDIGKIVERLSLTRRKLSQVVKLEHMISKFTSHFMIN
jgi:hypothetical protein